MLSNNSKRDSYQAAVLFAYHLSQARKIFEDPEIGIGLRDVIENAKSKVARDLGKAFQEDLENIELRWETLWSLPQLIWDHVEVETEE